MYFAMAFDRDFEWGDQLGEITLLDTLDTKRWFRK